jgi:hypothetical protein
VTKVDLTMIPGIDANTAMKILSEIGTDMSHWRSAKAFVLTALSIFTQDVIKIITIPY